MITIAIELIAMKQARIVNNQPSPIRSISGWATTVLMAITILQPRLLRATSDALC